MHPDDIKIGTSGWKFDDWAGTFYPLRVPASRWLEYYAARFPVGEINSTYYRLPTARTFEAIHARTPDNFRLTAKVHGDVTHARTHAQESVRQLLEGLTPLRESQKLIGLLAQFPTSFRFTAESLDYLSALRDACGETNLCVELRHASWDHDGAEEAIRARGLTWVSVDEPELDGLMSSRIRTTSNLIYVRLHGRNAAAWYHASAGDRYDYNYSETELIDFGRELLTLETPVRRALVFFNNCYHGQAPNNAKWLMQWMEQQQ